MSSARLEHRRRLLALVVIAVLGTAGCSSSDTSISPSTTSSTNAPSTSPPTTSATSATSSTTSTTSVDITLPGDDDPPEPPGTVLWERQLEAEDLPGEVWQVTYRSHRADGSEMAVSGIVARPPGEPPPGGFPVLAWAHGTTGIDDDCAPSDRGVRAVPRLREHLDEGYVVAATDYEGLGTPGIHPYLVADSEARSVLDAVRAARDLLGSDIAGSTVALLGHSQGGHAVLATAERASTYAPELDVIGTAALAPVADLELVIPALFDSSIGLELGIYVAAGWPAAHPELETSDLLTERGLALLDEAASTCVHRMRSLVGDDAVEELRVRRPADVPAWAARIQENTIRAERVPGPVLIAQGGQDTIVPRPLIDRLVDELCTSGVALRYLSHGIADHSTIVGATMPAVHRWFASLLRGDTPRQDCPGR